VHSQVDVLVVTERLVRGIKADREAFSRTFIETAGAAADVEDDLCTLQAPPQSLDLLGIKGAVSSGLVGSVHHDMEVFIKKHSLAAFQQADDAIADDPAEVAAAT